MTDLSALRGHIVAREHERRLRLLHFAPPPKLTLSQWADAYRMLSSESSPEPGRWRTSRAPYLREIMDACSDPRIERVVFIKPAQIGWTEVVNNACGYFMDQEPSPILLLQPTVDLAKMWSKERLDPMLRDTPKLHGKIREGNRREKDQSIQRKTFPGGFLAIQGANSAAGLRARPIRVVIADEVDGYPQSAKGSAKKDAKLGMIGEGDPLSLAVKRTSNFWNRKILEGSTPTLAGFSRIERDYGFSDQREFYLPCPHCGYEQTLKWRNLRWESGKPETAQYLCGAMDEKGEQLTAGCGAMIEEHQKGPMLARGRWIAARPGRRTAGFRINALYSPWRTWVELAAEWSEVHDKPEELKVFVNTVLAESWEDRGEVVSDSVLLARREQYAAEVPGGVGLVTCAVDVQGDRLEVLFVGWGVGEESWRVHHEKLWGDPAKAEVWAQLDLVRERAWVHESGAALKARWTFVDHGGHHPDAVARYCRARRGRNVYAVKGFGEPGRAPVGNPSKQNKYKVILFPLGSNALKDIVFARMKTLEAGPGYMHLPMTTTEEYCRQLVSEKAITRYVGGRPTRAYVLIGGRSNEALDLECYALAALIALGPLREQISALVEKLTPAPVPEPVVQEPDPPSPSLAQQAMQERRNPSRPRGSWVTGGGAWGLR